MSITKSVEFFAPYIPSVFNRKDGEMSGGNGMLRNGAVSVLASTSVSMGSYAFIQDGLVVSESGDTTVTVPDYASFKGPVHVVVSSPDSQESSGITVTVIRGNQGVQDTAIVAASRVNGKWEYPQEISLKRASSEALSARKDYGGGPISGAKAVFSESYGIHQGVRIQPGVASGPDGMRRELSVDGLLGSPSSHVEIPLGHVDPEFNRTDHIVLRKKNPGRPPQLELVLGETFDNGNTSQVMSGTPHVSVAGSATATNPSVADNFDGRHCVVWGDSTNLKLRVHENSSSRPGTAIATLAMGGTVLKSLVKRPRNIKSGDRLFGIASVGPAGAEDIHIFRTAVSGSTFNGAVAITALANSAAIGDMVIDDNGFAHVVFQHDEAGSGNNNQVYYFKYNVDDSVWGTGPALAVSPRILRGSNSGQNDTDPHIGIDNSGRLHVSFVRATSPAVAGDIVYLVTDDTGATVESERVISVSVSDGSTGAISPRSNNAKPRVSIGPHGDVFIAFLGDYSIPGQPWLRIFERGLKERTWFDSIEVCQLLSLPGHVDGVHSLSSMVDNLGSLHIVSVIEDTTSGTAGIVSLKFSPVIMSDGLSIDRDMLSYIPLTGSKWNVIFSTSDGYSDDSFYACMDDNGSIQSVERLGSSINHSRWTSQRILSGNGVVASTVHPGDSYISSISHTGGAAGVVDTGGLTVVSKRPWGKDGGISVVGDDGSHGGYTAIQDAIDSLKGIGGHVFIREGYSRVTHPIRVWSGVKVSGSGHCIVDLVDSYSSLDAFTINGSAGMPVSVSSIKHNILLFSGSKFISNGARPGDVIMIYDDVSTKPVTKNSGTLIDGGVVTRVISETSVSISEDISSTISSMTTPMAIWFATGCSIENMSIIDNRSSLGGIVDAMFAMDMCVNIRARSTIATRGLSIKSCRNTNVILSDIDSSIPLDVDGDPYGITLDYKTSLTGCLFDGGDARIGHSRGFEKLCVSGSTALSSWDFAHVTDVPAWSNNGGSISGTAFDAISDWGDSETLFAQKIKFNPNKPGHVDGAMNPFTDKEDLGSASNRWNVTSSKILTVTDNLGPISPINFQDMSILSEPVGGGSASPNAQPGIASVGGPTGHRINFFGSVHDHLTEIQYTGEPVSVTNGNDEITLSRSGVNTVSLRPGMICVFSGMSSYSGILVIRKITASDKIKVGRIHLLTTDAATSTETGTVVFYRGSTIGIENSRNSHLVISGGYNSRGGIELGVNDHDQNGYALATVNSDGNNVACIDGFGNFVDKSDGLLVVVDPIGFLGDFTLETDGLYIESTSFPSTAVKSLNGILPDGAQIDSMRVDWNPGQVDDQIDIIETELFGSSIPSNDYFATIKSTTHGSRVVNSTTIMLRDIDRTNKTYRISINPSGANALIVYGIEIGFHMQTKLTNIR